MLSLARFQILTRTLQKQEVSHTQEVNHAQETSYTQEDSHTQKSSHTQGKAYTIDPISNLVCLHIQYFI